MPVETVAPADSDLAQADHSDETPLIGTDDVAENADALTADEDLLVDGKPQTRRRTARFGLLASPPRQALLLSIVIVLIASAMGGWLGWRIYQHHRVEQVHERLLQVGRQGALNLTTVDWQHADSDVQRILACSTGTFYDDFSKRAKAFADVVKQAQSKSHGTVTAAGLESASDTEAQVLVAVNVDISDISAPEQRQRSWRMRISVHKVGDDVKVSNVEFVP